MHFKSDDWALVLGGSSGFGLACAKLLAKRGMSVCIVHRDRRGAMSRITPHFEEIQKITPNFLALNCDALSDEGIHSIVNELTNALSSTGKVKTLIHSIAFGNLKTIAPVKAKENKTLSQLAKKLNLEESALQDAIDEVALGDDGDALFALTQKDYSENTLAKEDLERTIYSMGTSLLDWTQKLFAAKVFADNASVFGLTSEGNQIAWRGYAAVSCAKVALEAMSRAIAVEFAPFGIRSNIIQAGVTDTPALNAIPGSEKMKQVARLKNPFGRLTTPEDVAKVIALLATDDASWVNGALIHADGGEHIAAL